MKRLTTLTDDELEIYLKKIKRIAKMEGEDALAEVDELIRNLSMLEASARLSAKEEDEEPYDPELEDAQLEINAIAADVKKCRKGLKKRDIEYNDFAHLRELLDDLGEGWSPNSTKQLQDQVNSLRKEGTILIDEMECKYYITQIETIASGRVKYSGGGNLIAIDKAVEFLKSKDLLTNENLKKARKVREEVAWARANKKLMAAEVALGSGNDKKSDRLKSEARVILKQDWQEYFPGEKPPLIEGA